MIHIKNGKLHFADAAFALPENFYVVSFSENAFHFCDGDGVYIQTGAEESPLSVEEILLDEVGEGETYRAQGAPFPITRANRQGKALFAVREDRAEIYYEERYEIENGTHFYIVVGKRGGNLSEGMNELLSIASIKNFLKSIE